MLSPQSNDLNELNFTRCTIISITFQKITTCELNTCSKKLQKKVSILVIKTYGVTKISVRVKATGRFTVYNYFIRVATYYNVLIIMYTAKTFKIKIRVLK